MHNLSNEFLDVVGRVVEALEDSVTMRFIEGYNAFELDTHSTSTIATMKVSVRGVHFDERHETCPENIRPDGDFSIFLREHEDAMSILFRPVEQDRMNARNIYPGIRLVRPTGPIFGPKVFADATDPVLVRRINEISDTLRQSRTAFAAIAARHEPRVV